MRTGNEKILLDTNAYTKFLSGDERVLEVLGKAETIYIPVVVITELLVGFKGGTKKDEKQYKGAVCWNEMIMV